MIQLEFERLVTRTAYLVRHGAKVRIHENFDFFPSEPGLRTDENIIKQEDSGKIFTDVRPWCHPKIHSFRLVSYGSYSIVFCDEQRPIHMERLGNDRKPLQPENIVRPQDAVKRTDSRIVQIHPFRGNAELQQGFLHGNRLVVIEGRIVAAQKQAIDFLGFIETFRGTDSLLVKYIGFPVPRIFRRPQYQADPIVRNRYHVPISGRVHGKTYPYVHADGQEDSKSQAHQQKAYPLGYAGHFPDKKATKGKTDSNRLVRHKFFHSESIAKKRYLPRK